MQEFLPVGFYDVFLNKKKLIGTIIEVSNQLTILTNRNIGGVKAQTKGAVKGGQILNMYLNGGILHNLNKQLYLL